MIPCSSPSPTPSTATTSPLDAFDELIDGCELDVRGTGYETFDDLVGYCRLVAGSVGRLSLGVFGARYPESAEPRADALGVALQLTNILRDVVEDRAMGRVYLPRTEAAELGCAPDLSGPTRGDRRRSSPPRSRAPRSTSTAASRCCRCSTGAAGPASRRWPASTTACSPGSPPTRRRAARAGVAADAREAVGRRPAASLGRVVPSASGRRVVVVGGGLAGIAAALDAADAGADGHAARAAPPPRRRARGRSSRHGLLIDNGQHVFMRCCTEYRAFLERIGRPAR